MGIKQAIEQAEERKLIDDARHIKTVAYSKKHRAVRRFVLEGHRRRGYVHTEGRA